MDGSAPARAKRKRSRFVQMSAEQFQRQQPEFRLHCVVADLLRKTAVPGLYWTTLPFGEERPGNAGARLKRLGTRAGAPDIFLILNGRPVGLELKTDGGVQSEEQKATERDWTLAGGLYHLATGYREAFEFLDLIGALRTVPEKHRPRDEASVSNGGAA